MAKGIFRKERKEKQVGFVCIEANHFIPEGHELIRIRDYEGLSDVELSDLSAVAQAGRVGHNLLYRKFIGLSIRDDSKDGTTRVKFRLKVRDEGFKRILFRRRSWLVEIENHEEVFR